MVMPLSDLTAIYQLLFRDGVIVVKKEKRLQSMHPEIEGVSNLKVINAMGSLKSKGCVRETYAWKHAYYFLTNEGIVHLRDYLHLPAEITPATLKCICRPASSAQVQTVQGAKSYSFKQRAGRKTENIHGSYQQSTAGSQLRGQRTICPKRYKDLCGEEELCAKTSFQTSAFTTKNKTIMHLHSSSPALNPSSVESESTKETKKTPISSRVPVKVVLKEVLKTIIAEPAAMNEDAAEDRILNQKRRESPAEFHKLMFMDCESSSEHCPKSLPRAAFTVLPEEEAVYSRFSDMENAQRVLGKMDLDPTAPSECSGTVLKIPLPQRKWGSFTEDPEDEQGLQKASSDFLEGLNLLILLTPLLWFFFFFSLVGQIIVLFLKCQFVAAPLAELQFKLELRSWSSCHSLGRLLV